MAFYRCSFGQNAKLGTKSITANGTYNASSDNFDGYSSVIVNVGDTSTVSITDDTLTEDLLAYEVPFDNTKTVEAFIQYCTDSTISNNSMTGAWAQRKVDGSGYLYNLHITNGTGAESSTNSNVTLTIDDTLGKITMTSESRKWRNGKTYRNIIVYAETT